MPNTGTQSCNDVISRRDFHSVEQPGAGGEHEKGRAIAGARLCRVARMTAILSGEGGRICCRADRQIRLLGHRAESTCESSQEFCLSTSSLKIREQTHQKP